MWFLYVIFVSFVLVPLITSGGNMQVVNYGLKQLWGCFFFVVFAVVIVAGVIYWVAVSKTGALDGSDPDHAIPIHNLDEYHRYPDGLYIKDPNGSIVKKGTFGLVRKDPPLEN